MQNEENQVLGMPDIGGGAMPGMEQPEPPKDKKIDKEAKDDMMEQMMFSPSSTYADSTISLDRTSDESEYEAKERKEFKEKKSEDILKILEKGDDKKLSEKYQKELLDKAVKDPSSVEVKTPQGWMTVRDAIDKGFNLVTGEFDREPIEVPDWNAAISELSPRDQETIRRLAQRNTPQAGPAPEGMIPPEGAMPQGEASLEEAGINPRPDVNAPEEPASDAGMAMGSAPEIPLGM